jgi:tRNA-specific adenosine deaminase 2
MCAGALKILNLNKIYFGCSNSKFGGCGSVINVSSEFNIINGILKEECIQILQNFYKEENVFCPEEKRKKKNKNEE